MKKLYSPQSEVELSLIRSILTSENIHFFVHNDYFGSMRIGPRIELYNAKTILVDEKDYDNASELVSNFLENTKSEVAPFKSDYTLFDRIRIVIEAIIFGWIIPGKRKRWKQ